MSRRRKLVQKKLAPPQTERVRLLPNDREIEIEVVKVKGKKYIVDFVTGKLFEYTQEELVRQRVEHFLVEERGYDKDDIEPEKPIRAAVGRESKEIFADLVISINGEPLFLIECKSMIEELEPYKKQALSYALLLAQENKSPARYTILTN